MEKLIIIRGPSGSGKSTVGKALLKMSDRPTLLVSEDQVRKMFNDHHKPGHDSARELASAAVRLGLKNNYDVIYEGILMAKSRQSQLDQFFAIHPEENYLFYLDVEYEETLRRHKTRPERAEFGPDAMARWWDLASPTNHPSETIIPGHSSLEETLRTIGRVAGLNLQKTSVK